MEEYSRLACEAISCDAYMHDKCNYCGKSLCIICIDAHHCPTGPSSSNLVSVAANTASSQVVTVAIASVPAVQSRAAFERNKKRAVLDLLAKDSNKCPKYSATDSVVDVRTYPLTVMTISASRSWLWNQGRRIFLL